MTKRDEARAALADVEAREEAATKGPWIWRVNLATKDMVLKTRKHLGQTVLRPRRWGMQSAMVQFCVDGLMVGIARLSEKIPGQEHNASWNRTVEHPDANYIAHARTDLPLFVAAFREHEAEIEDALEQVMELDYMIVSHDGELEDLNVKIKDHETKVSELGLAKYHLRKENMSLKNGLALRESRTEELEEERKTWEKLREAARNVVSYKDADDAFSKMDALRQALWATPK